jgi:drug/metabolite transporter (DMT)-like permease
VRESSVVIAVAGSALLGHEQVGLPRLAGAGVVVVGVAVIALAA